MADCGLLPQSRLRRGRPTSFMDRLEAELEELRRTLTLEPTQHRAHVRMWEIQAARGQLSAMTAGLKSRLAALDAAGVAPGPKVAIADTTLCCIDCANHALALRALRASLAGCAFERTLFLTDRGLDAAPIETVRIEPIRSAAQYSQFVMKELLRYIDTEYVLLVQWDGYVVEPTAWSEEFLLYDYVGARWPHAALRIPPEHAVGNGGFSLRSRTLLEALQDARIAPAHPEDVAVCRTYRTLLEREYGIAFAPGEVAERFSFEHVEPPGATFGFHGQVNLARFVADEHIRLLQF